MLHPHGFRALIEHLLCAAVSKNCKPHSLVLGLCPRRISRTRALIKAVCLSGLVVVPVSPDTWLTLGGGWGDSGRVSEACPSPRESHLLRLQSRDSTFEDRTRVLPRAQLGIWPAGWEGGPFQMQGEARKSVQQEVTASARRLEVADLELGQRRRLEEWRQGETWEVCLEVRWT